MTSARITAVQVNEAIQGLLRMALTHKMQVSDLTEMERKKIALCLQYRSEDVQELWDGAHSSLVLALQDAVVDLLNGMLLPDGIATDCE